MRSAAPIPDHGGSAPRPLRLEPAIDATPRDPEVVAQMSPAVTDPAWLTAEEGRLQEARAGVPWRRWGPYLSERQWAEFRMPISGR